MEGNAMTSSAEILPFPIARRRAFIEKHAKFVMFSPVDVSDRYVECHLRRHANVMRGWGIAEHLIERELKSMALEIDTIERRAHGVSHDMHGGRIAY
jgi:hypothetical protein